MATTAPPSLTAASAPTVPSVAATAAATGGIPNLRDRIPKLQARRRSAAPSNQSPAPETPSLPPPSAPIGSESEASFTTPRRRILSPGDHELFLASPTCSLLQAWVFGLAESVVDTPAGVYADALKELAATKSKKTESTESETIPGQWRPEEHQKIYQKNLPQRPLSPIIVSLLAILDEAEELVYATPPDDAGGSRFGNKRFRQFVDQVRQRAPQWHATLGLDSDKQADAAAEATAYLSHAFGNRARIDYGSGHELHFVVWLLCLYQLGLFKSPADDMPALVLCVFARYLDVMRVVQTTYYLEPAGSHGVWGLDDYQFLPFLFGAAQLLNHRYITPRAVHQPLTLEQFGDDYQYLGQVRFVNSIKVATSDVPVSADSPTASAAAAAAAGNSLRWHSPMLDDISAAKSWAKIEGGMRRMFLAEVLKKLPVMQHFLFGSLVPAAAGMTPARDEQEGEEEDSEDEDAITDGNDKVDVYQEGDVRHIHKASGWGDCCGIRVPSSFGAAGEMRKRGGDTLRRIPFD